MAKFPLLLEPTLLAQHLPLDGQTVIIEQASLETYQAGHIAQSQWLDFKRLQANQGSPGFLPSLEALSALFSELGITPDTHIICSDGEGGGWAGRLIWALDCLGHKHYSLLDGGLTAWKAAGLPLSQDCPSRSPSQYQAHWIDDSVTISKEQILANLSNPNFIMWDARSLAEYQGSKALAARAGHIPRAIHLEWTDLMDKNRALRLRDLESLRQELTLLGMTADKELATHCQTHHRSGLSYVVGKLLGLPIKGYAGSWAEWGNDPFTPITKL